MAEADRDRPSDPYFMESLARGLSVIRAFGTGRPHLTGADVAALTGLSRAAARRCLHTLRVLGYATARDGVFELTPAVLTLGQSYAGAASLGAVASAVLERLSQDLQESSGVAILDGDEIVFVARAATRRILSVEISVGSRLPAACTASGRVLLACGGANVRSRFLSRVKLTAHTPRSIVDKKALRSELDRVAAEGHAIVDEELELGLRSMAVPIRRHDGVALGALNIGVQAGRVDRCTMRGFLKPMQEAADEISRGMR